MLYTKGVLYYLEVSIKFLWFNIFDVMFEDVRYYIKVDVFFDLSLNKRLSKQSWGWWFETPSCPLWRHCNDIEVNIVSVSVIHGYCDGGY